MIGSRLSRKCFLVSLGTHGLLALIFLVGTAFFTPRKRDEFTPVLTMVPKHLIFDGPSRGGGNPSAVPIAEPPRPSVAQPTQPRVSTPVTPPKPTPPAPKPPTPKPTVTPPKPAPQEPRKPEARVETPKPPVIRPGPKPTVQTPRDTPRTQPRDHLKPPTDAPEPEPSKPPPLNLKPVERTEEDLRREQELAQARARKAEDLRLARALDGAMRDLQNQDFGQGTRVEIAGPGGEAYVNYLQFVQSVYDEAWVVSRVLASSDAVALVKVTIARAGHVTEARIVRRSGDAAMDQSVQRALDRVRFVAPFPAGTREAQRSFTIEFNLKTKRATG